MALAKNPIIDVSTSLVRPPPEKAILWPSVKNYADTMASDLTTFPSLGSIQIRKNSSTPEPLNAFTSAAQHALNRILVLDDYLFKHTKKQTPQDRYDQILHWLPDRLAATDVRFLTRAIGDGGVRQGIHKIFNDRANDINRLNAKRQEELRIQIQFTQSSIFEHIHDRFAIIDNELWHFGATVGGLHNLLSAATRGWDAELHEAIRFFEEAWAGDKYGK